MTRPTRSPGHSAGGDRPGLLAATLVFFIVLALSFLAAVVVDRIVDRQIDARITLTSDVLVEGIREGIRDVSAQISSVTGLFGASNEVTADEFGRFVDEIGLAPGMSGIGYMPAVAAEDLPAFEAKMARTFPGYEVFEIDPDGNRVPVRPRAVYFPVAFFEPREAVGRPLGLDGGSPPGRIRYLMESVASGRSIATPLVSLATTGQEGFVVYRPTVDESGTVTGVVVAPLILGDVLSEWVPPGLAQVLTWTVRDVSDEISGESGPQVRELHTPIVPPGFEGRVHSDTINVAGRLWQIDSAPVAGSPLLADDSREIWVLIVGLVMGLLAAAAVYSFLHKEESLRTVEFLSDVITAKNDFIAALSHKIGTPLTSVVGFAEVVREERGEMSSREIGELLDELADEASNLATIHEDLVVLGRAEYGTLNVEAVPVEIESEIVSVLRALDLADSVAVRVDNAGILALGDPGKIRRILRHLIANAKAHGGPNICVTAKRDGASIVVAVVDDGDGVPSDHSWDIFDPYLRHHDAMAGNPQSIGLGLSVSRTLAQHMGGDVTYRHADDKTVFELALPAVEAAPDQEPIGEVHVDDSVAQDGSKVGSRTR